jgi:hypothetical protein
MTLFRLQLLLLLLLLSPAALAAGSGSNDLLPALKFLASGWTALPGLVPQLKRPELRLKIQRAELHARLTFVDSAYPWMQRQFLRDIDIDIEDVCSIPSKTLRDRNASGKSLEELEVVADSAMDSLKRCRDAIKVQNGNATFPYFQSLNIHRLDQEVYSLATSRAMGRMAAVLLQEPRVSLYQTAVFLQRAGGGAGDASGGTSWHQDLNMVPLGA